MRFFIKTSILNICVLVLIFHSPFLQVKSINYCKKISKSITVTPYKYTHNKLIDLELNCHML